MKVLTPGRPIEITRRYHHPKFQARDQQMLAGWGYRPAGSWQEKQKWSCWTKALLILTLGLFYPFIANRRPITVVVYRLYEGRPGPDPQVIGGRIWEKRPRPADLYECYEPRDPDA